MIGVVLGTGWKDQIAHRFGAAGWAPMKQGWVAVERRHLYERNDAQWVTQPVRNAHFTGDVTTLILTNACGGLNDELRVGEVVAISDHINLTGACPDVGFLPLPSVYSCPSGFRRGVYAQVRGPAFETPAEARMLRALGADMVGMSTAIEAIQAAALGMRVIGLSLVTDIAGGTDGHDEVLRQAEKVDLRAVLDDVLEQLAVTV